MKHKKSLAFYIAIAAVVIFLINYFLFPMLLNSSEKQVSYDTFLSELEKGNIKEVEIDNDSVYYTLKQSDDKKADSS